MGIFLLYPHQLFENIEPLCRHTIVLIEEPLFFTQYQFHIQKLILHRASMRFYYHYLLEAGFTVEYCENEDYLTRYASEQITLYDPIDDWLTKKIQNNFQQVTFLPHPNFFGTRDNTKFFNSYYIHRRKELGIFIDEAGKPYGGKWSLDSENRKKLPKNESIPLSLIYQNRFIEEAKIYCKKFATIGECEEFYYPITFDEARANLTYFLQKKFERYGDYQDAIVKNETFLYHSNISSSLNIGILSLDYVIKKVVSHNAPLNAKEGFVRQIIGWREFMLTVYKSSHITLRTTNFFGFTRTIPSKLLSAKTGLQPFDDALEKLHTTAYNHHIERLMIISNLFLLLEIDPDYTYHFFMANYIDAYDWVMVGNLYGMSGFSDGGSITTKPYISSSNYIIKMSNDYKKTDPWCAIWDGLYWRFLDKYAHRFDANPRMQMQIALLKKIDNQKLVAYKNIAERFIKEIGI